MNTLTGTVIKSQSGFFWTRTERGVLRCTLRGRLKKTRVASDIATIGDHVVVTPTLNDEGAIEEVLPRQSKLARRAAGQKGIWKEDVIVANADQVVIVFAVANPEPHLRMLDRYLIMAEMNDMPAIIVANKCELIPAEESRALFMPYSDIGYTVLFTSTREHIGIDDLRGHLQGKLSALSGPSGVGKSSLLNVVQPGLHLRTSDISNALNKGRHTTVFAELHPLDGGGYVADTPGIREIGLWQVPAEDLDWLYREFRPFIGACYFQPCTHLHEPDCAVRQAVEDGEITPVRYDSYSRLREEIDAAVAY
jgi:ribosome biogenesis GTPase / thiamine phosphate phosphatase